MRFWCVFCRPVLISVVRVLICLPLPPPFTFCRYVCSANETERVLNRAIRDTPPLSAYGVPHPHFDVFTAFPEHDFVFSENSRTHPLSPRLSFFFWLSLMLRGRSTGLWRTGTRQFSRSSRWCVCRRRWQARFTLRRRLGTVSTVSWLVV